MTQKIWLQPHIIDWTQILLNNFSRLLGYELISETKDRKDTAAALFKADFVVVSHGIQADPIFNYGNQTALDLWGMKWSEFIQTPSRSAVEQVNREEREMMLEQARIKGYIDNYHGIRITSTGKRFYINNVIVWNLEDNNGNKCGQAATFSDWQFIEL